MLLNKEQFNAALFMFDETLAELNAYLQSEESWSLSDKDYENLENYYFQLRIDRQNWAWRNYPRY